MRTIPILLFGFLLFAGQSPIFAGGPNQKGYAGYAVSGCHHPCWRGCCSDDNRGSRRGSRDEGTSRAASGAVAESASLVNAVPLTFSMPMMLAVRGASFDTSRSTCGDLDERIDEMDARVEALHLRAQTIQRSVEIQTQILQELKDHGTIGGQSLPGLQQAPPAEPTPPAEGDADKVGAAQIDEMVTALERFKKSVDDVATQQQIDNVLKSLEAYRPFATQ